MRIGLDAKWYFEGPPSGRVVVRHLVDEIARLNDRDELFVFIDQRHRSRPLPFAKDNVRPVYVWAGNNLLANVFVLPILERRWSIDVMVVQNFSSFLPGARRIAFIHDALFLSHPQFYTWTERLYFAPMRFLARRTNGVCTVSQSERRRLLDFKFAGVDNDICVVHHGVDSLFRPRNMWTAERRKAISQKYGLPPRYLLYVGRLNVRKNIASLLRAVTHLVDAEIPLVIVGEEDWKTADHQQLVCDLNLKNRVVFTGPVYGEELAIIYALATVVCFPSYAESFGLPALEAMAAGVPIVVSNTTSLPEICGDAGNYVSPDDPRSIARMIDDLLSDQDLYRRKQEEGIARARCFTWTASASGLLEFIKSIYSGPKGNAN